MSTSSLPPRDARKFFARSRTLAAFLAAFSLVSSGLHRVDPFRDVPELREKWDHWQAHQDEFDTVFIGTSRIFHGLDPALFDRATARRTFNFGINALSPPEDAYVAEYILRSPPRNLRWVFFELSPFIEDFSGRDPATARGSHWHDWTRTALCIRAVLWPRQKKVSWQRWFQSEDGKACPAGTAWIHLRLFAFRSVNIGRGATALRELFKGAPAATAALGPRMDGFTPYPTSDRIERTARAAYLSELEKLRQSPARLSPLKGYAAESFIRLTASIRKAGAQPVAVMPPIVGPLRLRPPVDDAVPTIDVADPNAFPDLYVPEARRDMTHVNAQGAASFTHRFASQFLELMK